MVSFHLSVTFVALPRSTSIPAFWLGVPVSSLFNTSILSLMFTVFELTVVVVPFTVKSPAMTTVPVLSPCDAGSIVKLLGPLIYPVVVMLFAVRIPLTPILLLKVPPLVLLTVSVVSNTSVATILIRSFVLAALASTTLVPLVAVKSASSNLAPLKNTSTFPGLYDSVLLLESAPVNVV